MIVEWLVTVATTVWGFIADLLPDWTFPAALTDPNGLLGSIFAMSTGLAPFVDWSACFAVGLIPLGVWVAGVLWKALRMAASHIPFFGGNS